MQLKVTGLSMFDLLVDNQTTGTKRLNCQIKELSFKQAC